MKHRYIVTLSVETSERVTKKTLAAIVGQAMGTCPTMRAAGRIRHSRDGDAEVTKVRVRSVDVD